MSKKPRTKMKLPSKQNKDRRHFNSTKEQSDAILQTDRQDYEEGYILRTQNPNVYQRPIATKVDNTREIKESKWVRHLIFLRDQQMYTRPKRGIKLRLLTSLCHTKPKSQSRTTSNKCIRNQKEESKCDL